MHCRRRNVNAISGWTVSYATGPAPLTRSRRAMPSCMSCYWLHSTGGVNANKLSCTHEIREKITRKNIKMVQRCLLLNENNNSGIQQFTSGININQQIKRRQRNTIIVKMDMKEQCFVMRRPKDRCWTFASGLSLCVMSCCMGS